MDFINHENNIKKSLLDFPLKIEVCPSCNNSNIIKKRLRGKHRYYCTECKQDFNSPELECSFSELRGFDIYDFLNDLVSANIVAKGYQSTCYDCNNVELYPELFFLLQKKLHWLMYLLSFYDSLFVNGRPEY